MRPRHLAAVTLALVSAAACRSGRPATVVAPAVSLPPEFIRSYVGQRLILLQHGAAQRVSLRRDALARARGSCDAGVEVRQATFENGTASFTLEAKLWLFSVPRHPEGYGLFIGGSDLSGAGQRYTYFIVRHDGSFLIKRRVGDSTSFVTPKWTPSATVAKPDSGASGDLPKSIENTLTIRVAGETVSFSINGTQVFSAPATDVDVKGVVGYRVNHNLNVHLGPISITRQ